MLTADDITDEQIEALRERTMLAMFKPGAKRWDVIGWCDQALGDSTVRDDARAACARYINALPGDVECTVCFLRFNSGDSIATDSPICPVHKPRRKRT